MSLCVGANGCGCALQSSTLSITGSGTGASPWQIEITSDAFSGSYYTFADDAERTSLLPVPEEGDLSYLRDSNDLYYWNGFTWEILVSNPNVFSPSVTGSTTNPNLGTTGSVGGWYIQVGDMVHYVFTLTFNGTGIAQGSGTLTISAPATPFTLVPVGIPRCGEVTVYDSSASTQRDFKAVPVSGGVRLTPANSTSYAAAVEITAATVGITFAAGDRISGQVAYRTS